MEKKYTEKKKHRYGGPTINVRERIVKAHVLTVFIDALIKEYATNFPEENNVKQRFSFEYGHLDNNLFEAVVQGNYIFATSNINGFADKWEGFAEANKNSKEVFKLLPKEIFFDIEGKDSFQIVRKEKDKDFQLLGEIHYTKEGSISKVETIFDDVISKTEGKDSRKLAMELISDYLYEKSQHSKKQFKDSEKGLIK